MHFPPHPLTASTNLPRGVRACACAAADAGNVVRIALEESLPPLRIFPVRGSSTLRLHSEHGVPLCLGLSPSLTASASIARLAERIVPQLDLQRLRGIEGLADVRGSLPSLT